MITTLRPLTYDDLQGMPDDGNQREVLEIDLVRKMALYARSGVSEYWIADPERRTLVINRLQGEDYAAVEPDTDGWIVSPTFPELRVDLIEVFSGLD
jgi:Uma2 family endonuclease